ncbi:hypothetical protein [Streptomyces heilongjiangensis]|uniref:Uncharacterized protein n=1 Tax=Streptomyces heilongjiangensis TaxID=945052 RepID=A0ABW1B9K7_9ACTN|nr:hypothetical protein [Streptomyces heilongjiangensis]MDC2951592.1 hypothetical protein [Streptomyces heilongjiangensis]
MDMKPPAPAAEASSYDAYPRKSTSTTQAHRVLLYGALDTACVPLDVVDVQAVFKVAELDYVTVQAVIAWITGRTR